MASSFPASDHLNGPEHLRLNLGNQCVPGVELVVDPTINDAD